MIKTFDPIDPTSKLAICGLPIRLDTYRNCSFGCAYCFSNGRTFGGGEKNVKFEIGNADSLKNRLNKIFIKKDVSNFILIDYLIANDYTWHCGGMSDPFQPAEQEYEATKKIIDIANEYDRYILFSTKSDTTYNVNIKPNLHSFQLSVTNIENNHILEPNVPDIESRLKFFYKLKEKGFKVGIRIQPYIPGIANLSILEKFKDADHFTIEGIKIVANNLEQRALILELTGLNITDFKNQGLLNLRPEIRIKEYKPLIEWLETNNKSYSIADNDLHFLGNNRCCCGDTLVFNHSTPFNSTAMSHAGTIKTSWTLEEVLDIIKQENLYDVNCKNVFFSGSQGDCVTIGDFYNTKFNTKQSTFSPRFFYLEPEALELITKHPITSVIETKNNDIILTSIPQKNINPEKVETIIPDIQIEKEQVTADISLIQIKDTKSQILFYGWVCPKCNNIYSPAVVNCLICNPNIINNDVNFIPYWVK